MFGHPSQEHHKLAGMAKAASSPNTPKHLRAHLQKRVQEASMAVRNQTGSGISGRIDNLHRPSNKVPSSSILRSTNPPDVSEQKPIDPQSFDTGATSDTSVTSPMSSSTKNPRPAGTRPMNVTASVRPPRAPGLVASQGQVRNSRPAAKGLNQSLTVNAKRPSAPGLNQTVNPVRKTNQVTTVPAQRNRNVRQGSANPAFYGDF